MSTTVNLCIASSVVAGVTAYMAYVGMSASWQYYLTVDECLSNPAEIAGQRVRLNGEIAVDSLQIRDDGSGASFILRGSERDLTIDCQGPLPDNLSEQMDVVVEGSLHHSGQFHADRVITRCASKYSSTNAALSTSIGRVSLEGSLR